MKILIAGLGKVGESLAAELCDEDNDLTLVDNDPECLETLSGRFDVMTFMGNCASMKTLRDAGVEEADLLIVSTGSDEINLLCCMTAHKLNPRIHTIARIRDPEYAEQAYAMQDDFGLSLIFNPEKQTAVEIERLLKYPAFLKRDSFVKGRVEIVELRIDEESKLCNVTLMDMYNIVKCKVLVCAVLRDGVSIIPRGDFTLMEGDRIFVTASYADLSMLLKNLGLVTHKIRNTVIAGGGMISYYLAQLLENDHMNVHIIEKDRERCQKLAELLPDTDIICGDAMDRRILESERFNSSDALISLTGIDEMNILISLYGSSHEIPKVITKLGRIDDSNLLDNLSVGSTVSPRSVCSGTVVRYVRSMRNQTGGALALHSIAEGHAEAIEFPVDADTKHLGEPLRQISSFMKKNVLIACISRGKSVEIPGGDSCFMEGDRVVVINNDDDVLLQLNDIFE